MASVVFCSRGCKQLDVVNALFDHGQLTFSPSLTPLLLRTSVIPSLRGDRVNINSQLVLCLGTDQCIEMLPAYPVVRIAFLGFTCHSRRFAERLLLEAVLAGERAW